MLIQLELGGLLHDIGKVVCDQEGTHVDLGVDLTPSIQST
jgi:HD superfamily phosphodiesterase